MWETEAWENQTDIIVKQEEAGVLYRRRFRNAKQAKNSYLCALYKGYYLCYRQLFKCVCLYSTQYREGNILFNSKSFQWIIVLTYLDNHSKWLPYKKLIKQRWSYLSAMRTMQRQKWKLHHKENNSMSPEQLSSREKADEDVSRSSRPGWKAISKMKDMKWNLLPFNKAMIQ